MVLGSRAQEGKGGPAASGAVLGRGMWSLARGQLLSAQTFIHSTAATSGCLEKGTVLKETRFLKVMLSPGQRKPVQLKAEGWQNLISLRCAASGRAQRAGGGIASGW